MNAKKTSKKIISGIRKFFKGQKKANAVVGLSGGVDSALVLALLVKSLGRENATALLMPNRAITNPKNMQDAEAWAKKLGVHYYTVAIDGIMAAFKKLPWKQPMMAEANLNARVRAVILYNYANSFDALVAGTGNKSEFYMGYFTKYGDAAADFFPIGGLYKKEVRALAGHLGVPDEFLKKTPSAELWKGQEDEKEMGVNYEELDEILEALLEKKRKIRGEQKQIAEKILEAIKKTEHKRKQPLTIKHLHN